MTSPAIADLIDTIGTQSPTLHAVVAQLRALVHQNAPEAAEALKYGGIFIVTRGQFAGFMPSKATSRSNFPAVPNLMMALF